MCDEAKVILGVVIIVAIIVAIRTISDVVITNSCYEAAKVNTNIQFR